MDEIGEDGLLRHDAPFALPQRYVFVGIGLFAIAISTWELHRGVWPPNAFSLFFLLILLGAVLIGVSAIVAGIAGRAAFWTVGPGRITIVQTRPFFRRAVHFEPDAVCGFEIREHEPLEGDNIWCAVLVAKTGERFETRYFGSAAAAERLRDQIENLFHAKG